MSEGNSRLGVLGCCLGPLVFAAGIVGLAWNEFNFVWQENSIHFLENAAVEGSCGTIIRSVTRLVGSPSRAIPKPWSQIA